MKHEELVAVMVPRSRLGEVYALLGGEPPAGPRADAAVIEQAVRESPEDTWAFLRLLAATPGEWLSIGEVREALGLGAHNLAGVLSTLPRRWRRRYGQSAPLPYEVDGTGEQRRYRMDQEVAEVVNMAPAPAQPRPWTREGFEAAMLDRDHGGGGPVAVEVLRDFVSGVERRGGHVEFGRGATGPMYSLVPDPARPGESTKPFSLNTGGDVGLRWVGLRGHPPYDDEAALRDLADRLSDILGISVPVTDKAFNVKLEHLLRPEVREAFFRVFDDVCRRLATPSS